MGKNSITTNNHKRNNKNDLILVHLGAGNHSIKYRPQYVKLITKACRFGMKVIRNAKESNSNNKVAGNQDDKHAEVDAISKLNDAGRASINLPQSTMQALAVTSQIIEQSPLTNTSVGSSLSFGGEVRNDASVILVADGSNRIKRKGVKRTRQSVLGSRDQDQNYNQNGSQDNSGESSNSVSVDGHSKVSCFDNNRSDNKKTQTHTQSQNQRCYFGLTNITNFRYPISRCLNFALSEELFPCGEKLGVTKCCFLVDNGMRFDGGDGDYKDGNYDNYDNRDGKSEGGGIIKHEQSELTDLAPFKFDDGYCEENANLRTKNAVRQHQYWDTMRLRLLSSNQPQDTYKSNLKYIGQMEDDVDHEQHRVQEKEKKVEGEEAQEVKNRLRSFQSEGKTKGSTVALNDTDIEIDDEVDSAIIAAPPAVTDTIGVLIQDKHHNIAMGVSSGGNLMKPDGRIGCACVLGASSYTMCSEEMNLFEEIVKPRLESQRQQHRLMVKRKKHYEKEIKRAAIENEKLRKKRKINDNNNDDDNGASNNKCNNYEDNESELPIIYKISIFATGNGETILQTDLARHCCQYMLNFLHLDSISHGQNSDEQYVSYGAMLSNAVRKAVEQVNGYVGVVGIIQQRVFYGTDDDDDDDDYDDDANCGTTVVWAHTTEALVFGASRGGRHPEVVFSRNSDSSFGASTFKVAHGEMHT